MTTIKNLIPGFVLPTGLVVAKHVVGSYPKKFVFKCPCGVEFAAFGNNVLRGTTRSCGCFKKKKCQERFSKTPDEKAATARRALWRHYRGTAKRRGIKFGLSFDKFCELTTSVCFYCGAPAETVFNSFRYRGGVKSNSRCRYNGVDRLDSGLGYTTQNSVACCQTCNFAKRSLSVNQFLSWVEKIYANKTRIQSCLH